MRHFDAWILRDPYSIWHYYSTGRRWQESVRDMIQSRQICAPLVDSKNSAPVDPLARSISSQPNCGLLQKLPPEIRLMIYGYVFGDEAVHLVQLKGKIRHVRCSQHKSASDIPSHRHCCPETMARWRSSFSPSAGTGSDSHLYPHTHKALPGKLTNSSLSLLRTCRAIYLEAADIPYQTLSFDIDDLHTFVAFSLTISPEHLARIKRLTVQWTPIWQPMTGDSSLSSAAGSNKSSIYSHTHNDHLWKLFWSRVQALEGLEGLYLNLDLGRFMGNAMNTVPGAPGVLPGGANSKKISLDVTEPWLQPLMAVRGLKEFDLCVSARCDALARNTLVEQIGAEAVVLRDCLREVMCLPREPSTMSWTTGPGVPVSFLQDISASSCGMDELPRGNMQRSQLMITAA